MSVVDLASWRAARGLPEPPVYLFQPPAGLRLGDAVSPIDGDAVGIVTGLHPVRDRAGAVRFLLTVQFATPCIYAAADLRPARRHA